MECDDAIVLSDIDNWCSNAAEYTTTGASVSAEDKPSCFGDNGSDVWFKFVANSTSLNIRVLGEIVDIYGITDFAKGTLRNPRLALYSGSCGELREVSCDQDDGDHIAEIYLEDVVPNSDYFLRVSSPSGNSGTFQLCISSFNLVPNPNSDCPTGVVLCDKSSFFVGSIMGAGQITDEVDENNTFCLIAEDNSAWYKWVAGKAGSLTFTITPNNPGDDIDFAVFELPNGLDDCSGKKVIRCMASGANGENTLGGGFSPNPFDEWDECTGPTGLSLSEADTEELRGCQTGVDNNFVSAFNMEEGKAYALIILNYSATGHGFSIDFGGTSEFLGPEADFITDDLDGTVCFGDPITFFDQSSFGDLSLVDWQWNFGEAALPQQLNGPGPHRIEYGKGGVKSVALTVESETGCFVTTIGTVIVEEPFDIQAELIHQSCPDADDASIRLSINSRSSITGVNWDNGKTGLSLTGLTPGNYSAIITNFNGCDTIVTYTIEAPQPLDIDQVITKPSCGGVADGSILIDVSGQAPPFLFNFNRGGGFTSANELNGLSAAIYHLEIQDANGCITDLTIPLGEVDIELDDQFDPVTPPSCYGFRDGQVELRIKAGTAPFMYDWYVDGTFVAENVLSDVAAGTLFVGIRDGLNCLGFNLIDVEQPDSLVALVDTAHISCFGEADGQITTLVSGGTQSYQYDWSNGINDPVASGLSAGQYDLVVTDANGCVTTASASIVEPPELLLTIDSTRDVICFGDATGALFYVGNGGSPPFSYTVDGSNYTDSLSIQNLPAGRYDLTIKDDRGCTRALPVELFEPLQLIVDAGSDTIVNLGYRARLTATHEPAGNPVLYRWSPTESLNCSDCPSPTASPLSSTTYTTTIFDDNGCTASDQVTVQVYLDRPVFIPSAITPDGDGINDRLAIFGGPSVRGVKKLQIFDRWGEMVYQGEDLPLNDDALGWNGEFDGRQLNPGVFVYVAAIEFIDSVILEFEGDITLIR